MVKIDKVLDQIKYANGILLSKGEEKESESK